MLKKILGLLAFLLLAGVSDAWANACASNLAGATGNWTAAGTWTSCGGAAPLATDTCTITAGDKVLIDAATAVCGVTTINGTVIGQETALPAHLLTITADGTSGSCDLTIGATGALRLRKNNRVAFDTNNGAGADTPANVCVTNGGVLDAQGEVVQTTIAAITAADGDATCGTTGRMYTITPAAGFGNAQTKGRVVFMSGQGENRQLEISRAPAAGAFILCTDFPDASSGTDTTGGQRLTPHSAFQGAHTFPVGRHSVPILGGNAGCTAAATPYRCCSGADAGTCSPAVTTLGAGVNEGDPHVGDKIAIIQDVWFYVSAATDSPPKGFVITATDVNPMPIFRGVNIANYGATAQAGQPGIWMTTLNNATVTPDFMFNNIHDGTVNVDGVRISGGHDYKIWWNANHDSRVGSGDTNSQMAFGNNPNCAACVPNNIDFSHNIFYRTWGAAAIVNQPISGGLRASNIRVTKNIVYDGCVTGTGECLGIEWAIMDRSLIANNLIYDMDNGNSTGSQCLAPGLSNAGLDSAGLDNWCVNGGGDGTYAIAGSQTNTDWFAMTHNYVSNYRSYIGFRYGPAYSNVFKNINIAGNVTNGRCMGDVVEAKGNFCMSQDVNDTAHYAAADCDGAGDNGCGSIGIEVATTAGGTGNQHKAVLSDNLIVGPFTGTLGSLRGVYSFSGTTIDYNLDLDHNTIDGRGSSISGIDFSTWLNPGSAITLNMRDNAGWHFNNSGQLFACSSAANVTDNVGNSYISTGILTAEKVPAGAFGTCSSTGTQTIINTSTGFRDRAALTGELTPDYNWLVGGAALTAGASPASSPIGVRVLRFNCDRLRTPWSNMISCDGSMPVPICNNPNCGDVDSDGVPDLLDNCPRDFNPSQYDSNSNGVGDACGG